MSELKQVHVQMVVSGRAHDAYAASRLLSFAALPPSGDLPYAALLFRQTLAPNSFILNTLLRAIAAGPDPSAALLLYARARRVGSPLPGAFTAIDEHLKLVLPNCYDAICLMLMICITQKHQIIMSRRRIPCLDTYFDKINIFLWPCFKKVIDMHLQCLKNCDVKTLWEDDTHPHYAIRCYAEFAASLIQLNVEYGNNQLDVNLEQLHMAIDNLLVRLAERFRIPKSRALFLLNNYDMIIAVLKEAGNIGKIPTFFEEKLESNISLFVEELLLEHFTDLIKFVKAYDDEESTSCAGSPNVGDVEPLVKDFATRWKAVLEAMHKDIITSFSNLSCGMEILKAAMAQLLNYYNSLSECVKMIPCGSTLNKHLVSITSISYEIRKYSRTI